LRHRRLDQNRSKSDRDDVQPNLHEPSLA
jgi:hypothetical protein